MRTWVAGALITAVAVAGGVWWLAGADAGEQRDCVESVRAAEALVRTERWDPPEELPGAGDYPEIHWQVRALGSPCSRVPGPTDYAYQGVLRLQPADARALARRYTFAAPDPDPGGGDPAVGGPPSGAPDSGAGDPAPGEVWPALRPYLPAGATWLTSRSWDEAAPTTRWRSAYLDVRSRTLVFRLSDH